MPSLDHWRAAMDRALELRDTAAEVCARSRAACEEARRLRGAPTEATSDDEEPRNPVTG